MKKTSLILCALFSISLGACNSEPAAKTAPAKTAQKPAAKANPNASIEEALAKVPPEQRNDFQAALQCDVKKSEKAIQITAEYIGSLYARFKADPSIAKC